MRLALLALASVLIGTAAVPQTVSTPPADVTARAKFPHDSPQLIDMLQAINRMVNGGIQGESDQEHYGVEDFWVMLPADSKGDCEDYALTKIFFLQQAGVPIVTSVKLVAVVVHMGKDQEGHAILAIRLPSGAVAYMDSLRPELATRAELVAAHYQFFDWKA